MTLHLADRLSEQLDRLRTLYALLASGLDSRQQDDLIERTRVAIADVRGTRALLAAGARERANMAEVSQAD